VAVCPAKDKSNPRHKSIDMAPIEARRAGERENWSFFEALPEIDRTELKLDVKHAQLCQPLFEFSGACSGCGETPYLKLASQLFGDRMLIANATGCSSIYGGNQPTTPWSVNKQGRGPAWANSLFEDNAEFGLGFRFSLDQSADRARALLAACAGALPEELVRGLVEADQANESGIAAQRARVAELRRRLSALKTRDARTLEAFAEHLVRRSVWIIGGDGWAYDIGFGGLDHLFSSRADVNVLVLDTEVYSNTGGQQSKATPIGATAKFAAAGRSIGKKDLGLIAMSYGHVYVASVALYARDAQVVKAFAEAESYPGPSLIIAHSPCIAHGYDLSKSGEQQKLAVDSGVWPVYRFDPRRMDAGELPLAVDSGPPKARVADYMKNEGRFQAVALRDPQRYAELVALEERYIAERQAFHEQLAGLKLKSAIAQGAVL
jgi:pyruvate-ferredoxin/flavodoxin oxidoreductase